MTLCYTQADKPTCPVDPVHDERSCAQSTPKGETRGACIVSHSSCCALAVRLGAKPLYPPTSLLQHQSTSFIWEMSGSRAGGPSSPLPELSSGGGPSSSNGGKSDGPRSPRSPSSSSCVRQKQAVARSKVRGPFAQQTDWAGASEQPRTDFFIIRRNVVAVPKAAHAAIHAHAAHAAHAAHSTCVGKHSVRHVPPWPQPRAAVLAPPVLARRACPPRFDAEAAHRSPSHRRPCHPCHRPRQSRPCTPCPPPRTTW